MLTATALVVLETFHPLSVGGLRSQCLRETVLRASGRRSSLRDTDIPLAVVEVYLTSDQPLFKRIEASRCTPYTTGSDFVEKTFGRPPSSLETRRRTKIGG